MNKLFAFSSALALATASFAMTATIREGSVTASQTASHRLLVNYTLDDGPAIVTFDVLTNGVSIGGSHIVNVAGDVFCKVESGDHTINWNAQKDWPGFVFPKDGDVAVSVKVTAWDLNLPPEVMVIDLLKQETVSYYASLDDLPGGVQDDVYKTDKLVLRKIPAEYVEWKMGSPTTEPGYNTYNDKQHSVTLTSDYFMGVYEVTQKQWFNVMGTKPSYFNNPDCWETRPVEKVGYSIADNNHAMDVRGNISWPTGDDPHAVHADSFIGKLRTLSGLTTLDLPTDAQWEYAARAGSDGPYYGDLAYGDANLATLARYRANGYVDGTTVPEQGCTTDVGTASVGSYLPNVWGLYDMLGNVDELCLDRFENGGFDAKIDPKGSETASAEYHVYRGGSWREKTVATRCGSRGTWADNLGYQVDPSERIWVTENFVGLRLALHLN